MLVRDFPLCLSSQTLGLRLRHQADHNFEAMFKVTATRTEFLSTYVAAVPLLLLSLKRILRSEQTRRLLIQQHHREEKR